jgi:hypothetical protein
LFNSQNARVSRKLVASRSLVACWAIHSKRASASGDQVDNQHDDGDNQQQVDHAARYMQAEAKNPKSQNDYKECPKHCLSP